MSNEEDFRRPEKPLKNRGEMITNLKQFVFSRAIKLLYERREQLVPLQSTFYITLESRYRA